ncbi:MAG TPA: isoleucine--tRNA ligase [Phycisphaerales bacterium]|nr:isoleucine--tRNA ligase [Phycisphaerales bacterium]
MSDAPVRSEKPAEKKAANRYKDTLNLPKTSFAMKANLVQNEPASIERWGSMGLYGRLRAARAGREKFVFHDGPPYANGSIHLGHVLNKTLKDIVVRSRSMMGFDVPYVPGWDCHGLPIEHKVMTGLVESGKIKKLATLDEDTRKMAVRRECQAYAEKYVKLQAGEMVRLLTLADYENPYLTMRPEFEGAVLETLAALVEQGLVYRALKPVHWSIANETALAEAELEYYDREDLSVYVDFEADDADAVYDAFGLEEQNAEEAEEAEEEEGTQRDSETASQGEEEDASAAPRPGTRPGIRPSFMIWTTTPWTLPANLAIAVNPRFEYALVWVDGNVTVMASEAVERVTRAAKAEEVVVLAKASGERLVGLRYRHPFVEEAPQSLQDPGADRSRCYTLVTADYVTLEDGTGLVHTAPGHGAEDFATGKREGLPVYCPVRHDGTYDRTVPDWLRGVDIWKANEEIAARLGASGHLFFSHRFTHSYPHDWRSKTPVVFRCTEQWFIGVDAATEREGRTLRELALATTESDVDFVPAWGRNRMRGMLESRPDWCISRQRSWGLPIPAFFTPEGECLMTGASVRAVARLVREQGSDAWFKSGAEDLLRHYDPASDPDCPPSVASSVGRSAAALRKSPDILDVWFESGSTWNGCMRERLGDEGFPVELYLEGSDQHRGWFQSSLLASLGATGRPPFRAILTHGFMVDKDGRKLSKSAGHTVEDLFKLYGADVVRWWVCSLSYENDMKVDDEFFKLAGESYRKVRNTLRFMLSNLYDYPPAASDGAQREDSPASLDAWVLAAYAELERRVTEAYERYDFKTVHGAVYDFCNDALSAVYLAAVKDRLYCDRADSPRRRRTQATLWTLTDGLCRLIAPVLPHTADEAWRALWNAGPEDGARCVHLEEFLNESAGDPGAPADTGWTLVMAERDRALQALERAKTELGVENPLDAGVVLPDAAGELAAFDPADLADLLGVSRVELDRAATEPRVLDLRAEPRCERSWKRDGTVRERSDGGMLTDRDAEAVGVA